MCDNIRQEILRLGDPGGGILLPGCQSSEVMLQVNDELDWARSESELDFAASVLV